eukprot:2426235-Alexandrium_andersonii.AAC.1
MVVEAVAQVPCVRRCADACKWLRARLAVTSVRVQGHESSTELSTHADTRVAFDADGAHARAPGGRPLVQRLGGGPAARPPSGARPLRARSAGRLGGRGLGSRAEGDKGRVHIA